MRSFASFKKVKVSGVVVDMDGDEMTKIIWKWIKEKVRNTKDCHTVIAHLPLRRFENGVLRFVS